MVLQVDQIIADPFIAYGLQESKIRLVKMQRNLEHFAELAERAAGNEDSLDSSTTDSISTRYIPLSLSFLQLLSPFHLLF